MPGQNKDLFEPEVITAKDLTTVSPQVKLSGKYPPMYEEDILSMSRLWPKGTTGSCGSCLDVTDNFYPIESVL